ncbi:MAG: DUF4190 domain-containing protein [Acidimicrobiales bacterium]
MSDTSQGPGWWLASDGKWYSPEQAPGYEPAPVPATAPSAVSHPGTLPATGTLPPTAPLASSSSGPSVGTLPPTAYPPAGGYPPGAYPPGAFPPGSSPQGAGYPYAGRAKTSGLAIAAFVLSLLWIVGLGSLLAVIFGIIALVTISRSHGTRRGRGWAIAGLVIGALGLILTVAVSLAIKNAVVAATYPYGQTVSTDDGITGFTSVTVYSVTTGLHGQQTSGILPGTFAAADVQVCVGSAGMPDVSEHLAFFLLKMSGGSLLPAETEVTSQSPSLWHSGVQWPANQCQRGYISFLVPSGETPQGVRYNGDILHPIEWTASGN